MNSQELLSSFDRALAWNAVLYSIYKITSTALTFILYARLTADQFCLWANTNSIIFITLLWSDCGLRYAATQFMPTITSSSDYQTIIRNIIVTKLVLIALSTPVALFLLVSTIPGAEQLGMAQCITIALWYIAEGLVAIMQTLYHAQFQNKLFNLLHSTILIGEIVVIAFFAFETTTNLVFTIYAIKAVGGITLTILSLLLFKNYEQKQPTSPTDPSLYHDMARHAGVMWATSSLKSLSERNVLMPIITRVSGTAYAATFKLALDAALVLQRTVLKTIGTADSALLTHARTQQGASTNKEAQKLLIKRITWIIGILLLLYALIGAYHISSSTREVIILFYVLLFGYAAELRLLPYERMLEVHQDYRVLIHIYIWYAVGLTAITGAFITTIVPPIIYISLLQLIRFASVYWMSRVAKRKYA